MTIAMRPIDKLLPLATNVVEIGEGKWKCNCSVHEMDGKPHEPSLHITEKADGTLLLKCMACDASQAQVVHGFGLTMSDLFPDHAKKFTGSKSASKGGKKVAEYVYRDAQGCIAYRTERFERGDSKYFSQSRPNGQGGWVSGVRGVERVPYRLPELIVAPKDQPVFVVEGEKKADYLVKWGLVATCNVGGAGKWNKEFSTRWLRDRTVIILPDNDPIDPETGKSTGFEHARKVLEYTQPVAEFCRILELPGLPPKGDVVDWIDGGGTLPQLLELVAALKNSPEVPATVDVAAQQTQQMDPLDLRLPESRSDIANGRRLIRDHGKSIRYCYPWSKWLVWDGQRWIVDQSGEVYRLAKTVADKMWDEMRAIGRDVDETTLQRIMAFAKYSSGSGAIAKALECAASEPGYQVLPGQLDSDPWLLNCPNGTVNLQNGEIRPHNQEDLLTKISPTEFDPDATCPAWEQFLLSIFDSREMVEYMQRLCGYWATGVIREQSLPILWGQGSNGKGTFLNAFMETMGQDYAIKAPSDFLMAKRNESHPTDKADLFGKRLVIGSETEEGKRLNESMVKELTGNEPIRARRMREDFWEFKPTHKLILVTNHLPQIRGTDHGIWRRIRRIQFGKTFWNPDLGETGPPELIQDKNLEPRLAQEHPGILAWIIRGCISWWHDGELAPESIAGWTQEYRKSQDVLGAFVEECCEVGNSCIVEAGSLYRTYRQWTESNGEQTVNQRQFGQAMNERGFERFKSGTKWYRGLRVSIDDF